MKSLWLDDERPAPSGWIHVQTAPEAIRALESGQFSEVSLDHDLGRCGSCGFGERHTAPCPHRGDGYQVACWLEERVNTDPTFPVPRVYVHTQNAAAMPRMVQAVDKIERVRQQRLVEDK